MENNNELINKVFKSRKHILSYLKNIGYNTGDYEHCDLNYISNLVENEQADMLLSNNKNNKIFVKYYIFKKTLRLNVINEMISDLFILEEDNPFNKDDTLLIIIKDIPNQSLKTIQRDIFSNENIFVNIFGLDSLQYNILDHSLVPLHVKLTDEEIVELKETYNITEKELPTISRYDPPVMANNIKPGEIIRIERSCKNSIQSNYYRLCINE